MTPQLSDDADTSGRQGRSVRPRGAKRSRKGCPECRRRKIKCDERQPRCGQCRKGERECHLQDSVFKPHALSTPPSRKKSASKRANAGSPSAVILNDSTNEFEDVSLHYANDTIAEATPCPSIPIEAAVEATVDIPYEETGRLPTGPTALLLTAADQLRIGSQQAQGQAWSHEGITARHLSVEQPREVELAATPATDVNGVDAQSTIGSLKDTQEELFLLRHYSECIAPWMDLLYRYEVFSREVLTLARQHPILRHAACAVAAKQLGQMTVPVSTVLRGKTQERIASRLTQGRLGFTWYGIKYYEKAIQTLVKSITPREPQATTPSAHSHASPALSLSQGELMVRADGEDPIVRLLGTCILIQYEHLSANRDAWSGHLTGFSKLLDLIDEGKLLERHPMFEQVYPWTKDIMEVKAGFWNFVVNDLEESFVSHRRTRIDTTNLSLWRNMGLLIKDNGRLSFTSGTNSLANTPEHARDKVLSYTLIRLLCKLIDFIAPLPDHDPSLNNAVFANLEDQFNAWVQMLSPSFHPDGTFATQQDGNESGLCSREMWFSNDLCSTTMMYYHMARMLLLIHQPPDLLPSNVSEGGGTSFDLLRTFRGVEQKLQFHASEAIAIVRGTPCDAVRLRAIQPLYVAGRCCSTVRDRKILVEMLTDIQDHLGIATGYRIKALLQEWGASYQEFGLEERLTAEERLGQ